MRRDKIMDIRDWQEPLRLFNNRTVEGLRQKGAQIPFPDGLAEVEVSAYVNAASWKAQCPFCTGVELLQVDDPVFYCLNPVCPRPEGNRYLPAVFPAYRLGIEGLLMRLPFEYPVGTNEGLLRWWRDETLSQLADRVSGARKQTVISALALKEGLV